MSFANPLHPRPSHALLPLLALLLAAPLPALAAPPATASDEAMAGFDEFATDALKSWNAPGATIAVVSGGNVIYARGFGLRDVKGNSCPTTTSASWC